MSKSQELLEIVSAYTGNRITLGQAIACIKLLLAEIATPSALNIKNIMNMLGHRLHSNDEHEIEHGFNGSIDNWIAAGHTLYGHSQLFKDNYHFYKEQTCTLTTQVPENVTVDSRPHNVPDASP